MSPSATPYPLRLGGVAPTYRIHRVKWDITSEHYYEGAGSTVIGTGEDRLFAQLAQFGPPIIMTGYNQIEGSYQSPGAQATTVTTMMSTMNELAPKYNIIGAYLFELLDEPRLTGAEAHFGMASSTGALNTVGLAVQQFLAG